MPSWNEGYSAVDTAFGALHNSRVGHLAVAMRSQQDATVNAALWPVG
jgi:hypothetical protein